MSELCVKIKKIKNISDCELEVSLDKGLYAIVGENSSGKSTIMQAMSLLVRPSSWKSFKKTDYCADSTIDLDIDGTVDSWYVSGSQWTTTNIQGRLHTKNFHRGFYEGSIFYGTRFYDFNLVDAFLDSDDFTSLIIPADDFVKETLSFILHGDKTHYKDLYKVKKKDIAIANGFKGMPYFLKCDDKYISQYNMSSGESMLLSLIDFINNLTEREHYSSKKPLLFLIDEAELALHPAAINRLISLFNDMIKHINMVVLFSTHSTEIINKIQPQNIYMIENHAGKITCLNPCYPNYAIRNLYVPNGYDFIILVEDDLAKAVVERVIRSKNLGVSRLWYVVPSGDWAQTLKLQRDIQNSGLLGIGKRVVSILDGDVQSEGDKKAKEYGISLFMYLPIKSVEKYLRKKMIVENDAAFIKLIGDKYFTRRSLSDIIMDYQQNYPSDKDKNGKKFYKMICSNLNEIGINKDQFIQYLCEDICSYENFSQFISTLSRVLT